MSVALRACGVTHELRGRPWLMGIVNATPDSFSDAGLHPTLESRLALAVELVAAGARVIDVGGESGVTNRPVVAAAEEIERVVPLVERVAALPDVLVSVDTYKPAVAEAAIAAGAVIVNDVSGLRDPELADVCVGDRGGARRDAHAGRSEGAPAGPEPLRLRRARGRDRVPGATA
jgi:dihydropteroate synthase